MDQLPPALVLTAGLGTRLDPLTRVRAKPAVPVAGVPLVLRVLRWLHQEGVRSAVLNLHHKPESITRVVGHGGDSGVRVRYSWEPRILGSAGGPRHALDLLGSRFFLVNGDTLIDLDLRVLQRRHEDEHAAVTLAVSDNPDPSRYGGVLVNDAGRATGFTKAGRPSQHFVGVQLVEASVFEALPAGTPVATVGGLYDELLATGTERISTHRVGGRFHDVGTMTDYLTTSLFMAASEGAAVSLTGQRSQVHPTAKLVRTILWDDVTIDAGCRLTDCIVTDGVHVPRHTVCEHQAILSTPDGPRFFPVDGQP